MAEDNLPDIDHGLASLTEETTAAEFLRSKGQHKKVKTINKEKLKQWISQAINQTRAGMANAYNDEEKEELLKKTQEQLEEVMARAAKAEAEVQNREQVKDDMAREIEQLQARAAEASDVEDKSQELAAAMATIAKLQDQYNVAHKESEDLRLDVYELQDQLNTKMALSRSTMEEKDRLKETMQGLMVRAGDLTSGVLQLDQEYYAGQHASEAEIDEDAELTEQFFHDFEVGSKVIDSLAGDLSKLREISQQDAEAPAEDAGTQAIAAAQAGGLLSRDLQLLEQLKSGSLAASDVAAPVEGLVEALSGAREEANILEQEATAAMGVPQTASTVSELPDADGEAAEVIAGATSVARELAALLAKERKRISALQMMIDEADSARNSEEEIAEKAHQSYDSLLGTLSEELERAGLSADETLVNEEAPDEERVAAAQTAIADLAASAGNSDAEKYYNALLNNINQQASEQGVELNPAINDGEAELAQRNAAAAQAVLELAQKAADVTVAENYDALLGEIADQAEAAEIEKDDLITDADADAGSRKEAAMACVSRLAAKAADDSVQNNYDALLERLAEEAKETEVEVAPSLTDNDAQIEERQAEAEKVVEALAEASSASKDMVAIQEQLDEALQDVDVLAPEPAAEDELALENEAPAKKNDHAAVKALLADRVGTLVAKIKSLEEEHGRDAEAQAKLTEEKEALAAELAAAHAALAEAEEAAAAAAAKGDDKPHERELAQTVMKAVQGDEDLAGDDAVLDLALAIDDYNDEIAEAEDDKNLVDQSAKVIKALGDKKQELMTELAQLKASQLDREAKSAEMERMVAEANSERDEMAESGKEIISQLTQQRDAKVKEFDEAKQQLQEKDIKLNDLEESIHGFAERLHALVDDEEGQSDEVAAAKGQARDALSQMPGEKSVPLQIDVAKSVTASGIQLIDALSKDGGAKAKSLEEELQSAQAQAAERDSALADKDAAIADKDAALADKDKALEEKEAALEAAKAQAAEELQTAKAEAEEVAASGKEVIGHLTEQRDKLQEEIEGLNSKLTRLEEAEEANRSMAEQISSMAAVAEQQDEKTEDLENQHADLEVTLSEVPGEEDIPVRDGLSKDLAAHSIAVITSVKAQLAQKGDELGAVSAERDELKELVRQSRAAIEEYRARNEESSSSNENDLKDLNNKLAEAEKAKDAVAREMQEQIDDYRLEENVLKKKIDELNKQVAARDEEILGLKRDGDSGADERLELNTLQAQNEALEQELTAARQRLQEVEAAQSAVGGKEEFSVAGLKSEIAKLREEREGLMGRMRGIEDELATEKSRVESMKEDRQNLRSEFDNERSQLQANLDRERTAHGEDTNEMKRLRNELAGAQAKLRALSEGGDEA